MGDLLIITNSYDVTTDLLLDRMPPEANVFRFNFDQFDKYEVGFDRSGFCIVAPGGKTIRGEDVSKTYWRKPFNAEPEADGNEVAVDYVRAEWRYLLNEVVNLLWADNRFVLVEPYAERRTGKLVQLLHASRYFHVPPFEFISNRASQMTGVVVKSLSNELIGGKVLYTTRVETGDLDRNYPWFLQQEVVAPHDVTAVYVRGELFAFRLERDFLSDSPDWRKHISEHQQWVPLTLPADIATAIRDYMNDLNLNYGRLDFLLDSEEQYWFCEVNPNGQFAWLDLSGEHGLLRAVVNEISPLTEHHPLPVRHALDSRATCDSEELRLLSPLRT
jgi:hypothetical protein